MTTSIAHTKMGAQLDKEVTWIHRAGMRFRACRWPVEGQADLCIVVVHGHGEHIGRYQDFASWWNEWPIETMGYDHRGHGESDGKRGDADGIPELAKDLDELFPRLCEAAGCSRAVVFGHSMGGVVVTQWLSTYSIPPNLAGVVLSAPAFVVPKTPLVRAKIAIGRWIARIAPKTSFSTGLDASNISRDQQQVQAYADDPLVHNRISARLGRSLVDDGDRLASAGWNVQVPTLIYHGTADAIASIEGTRRFVAASAAASIDYHELEGFFHEPHHEPPEHKKHVFELWARWLTERLDQQSRAEQGAFEGVDDRIA